jgi:hypothetical protein
VPLGRFFVSGHDRRAIQGVMMTEYGSAAQFLSEHGYAPGGKHWGTAR